MTSAFIAVERFRKAEKLFKDADGCHYFKDNEHPALKGKEFANVHEAMQTIADYNSLKGVEPFKGEVILLNVLTF
jgi:hypothetical protein